MSGQNDLYIGIQASDQADQPLLPFHVQGNFRFIHKKSTMLVVLYEHGQQDNEHLFLSG